MTGTRDAAEKHRDEAAVVFGGRPNDGTGRADLPSPAAGVPPGRALGAAADRAAADPAAAAAHVADPDAVPGRRRRRARRLRDRLPEQRVPVHRRGDDRAAAGVLDRHAVVAEARGAQARGGRRPPLREVPARARPRAGGGGRAASAARWRGCTPTPGRLWTLLVKRAERVGAPARPSRLPARAARHRHRAARPRRRARPRHEPARRVPAAVAAGGAQARRAARDAARRAGRRRPRRGRRRWPSPAIATAPGHGRAR